MDNFERLFNEKRKNTARKVLGNIEQETKELLASEWFKLLTIGRKYYEEKNYSTALSFLNKAIEHKENHAHLFMVRANIKEDLGDQNGAIEDYKEALSIGSGDWYATYNQIAVNYLYLKNFNKALEAFNITIELKEKLIKDAGREDTMTQFHNGVVRGVDTEKIYTNRANVKLSLKDYNGCAEDCSKAMKINPSYSNSFFIMGLCFLQVGQGENAFNALSEAKDLGHPRAGEVLQQYFNN